MTLSTQFITMLTMVGMGSFFGASLDTYNRFLKRDKRKSWIVFFNDLLFWVVQGLVIFYVLFLVNEGELRFYLFIALLCGFAAYQSLIKHPFLKMLEIMISTIVSIWRFLVRLFLALVYRPILSLVALVFSLLVMMGKGLLTLIIFIGKTLWWCVKVLFKPIQTILLLFWKLLPKGIKKIVEKLYNKMAGLFRKIENYLSIIREKWKKQK
jgi:spore cortex biosynthesis protein YabQ